MLCKDCKYFMKNTNYKDHERAMKHGYCTHNVSLKQVSYLTGEREWMHAQEMRKHTYDKKLQLCGPNARYFLHVDDITPKEDVLVKSCTECKYLRLNTSWYSFSNQLQYSFCTHPHSTVVDVVSGVPEYYNASEMRLNKSYSIDDLHLCRNIGLFHEQRAEHLKNINAQSKNDSTDAFKRRMLMMFWLFCMYVLLLCVLKRP